MKVFRSSVDWWVAESAEDAAALHLEHYEESLDEMCDELTELPPEHVIGIICDASGNISDSGETVRRTASDWATREPRGLLASTEY